MNGFAAPMWMLKSDHLHVNIAIAMAIQSHGWTN